MVGTSRSPRIVTGRSSTSVVITLALRGWSCSRHRPTETTGMTPTCWPLARSPKSCARISTSATGFRPTTDVTQTTHYAYLANGIYPGTDERYTNASPTLDGPFGGKSTSSPIARRVHWPLPVSGGPSHHQEVRCLVGRLDRSA